MKKIIFIILILSSISGYAQTPSASDSAGMVNPGTSWKFTRKIWFKANTFITNLPKKSNGRIKILVQNSHTGRIEYMDSTIAVDTTFLSNRINQRVKYTDTSNLNNVLSCTYWELKYFINNSLLKPGRSYRITDFKTLHKIPNTTDRNDTYTTIPTEVLIVRAIATNKISNIAQSEDFPNDIIHYTVDSTAWKDLYIAGQKGCITLRIDPIRNIEVGNGDWRNFIVRRWKTDLKKYTRDSIWCLWDTACTVGIDSIGAAQKFRRIDTAHYDLAGHPHGFKDVRMFIPSGSESAKNVYIKYANAAITVFDMPNIYIPGNALLNINIRQCNNVTVDALYSTLGNMFTNSIAHTLLGANTGFGSIINCFIGRQFSEPGGGVSDLTNSTIFCRSTYVAGWPGAGYLYNYFIQNVSNCYIQGPTNPSFTFNAVHIENVSNLRINATSISDGTYLVNMNFNRYKTCCLVSFKDLSTQTPTTPLFFDPNANSNIAITAAAASSISLSNTSTSISVLDMFAGVINVTGSGSQTINTVTRLIQNNFPIRLVPASGLTITIAYNNVAGGFIQRDTFTANGTLGENIIITPQGDRWMVTSGHINSASATAATDTTHFLHSGDLAASYGLAKTATLPITYSLDTITTDGKYFKKRDSTAWHSQIVNLNNTKQATMSAGNGIIVASNVIYADTTKLASRYSPSFVTQITTPLIVGGTAVGDSIIYKSTTGAGTLTQAAHVFKCGTNGGTTAMTILNNGNVGLGTTRPSLKLDVVSNISASSVMSIKNSSVSGYSTFIVYDNGGTAQASFGYANPSATFRSGMNYFYSNNKNFLFDIGTGNFGLGGINFTPLSKFHVGISPTASSAYGLVSLASGNFTGAGVQPFAGAAGGTVYAINTAANTAANFADWQHKGVSKFKVDSVGNTNMTGTLTASNVLSGTYTPTFTNTTNISASTPRLLTYSRTGNRVSVSGQMDITATVGGLQSLLTISLPIASALTTQYQAGGTGNSYTLVPATGGFYADAANDKVIFEYNAAGTLSNSFSFEFSYEVL